MAGSHFAYFVLAVAVECCPLDFGCTLGRCFAIVVEFDLLQRGLVDLDGLVVGPVEYLFLSAVADYELSIWHPVLVRPYR